ncbi:MAG: hypothetical protein FGM46_10395, partial [Ferruginibacter sp.]|nr:hypothetical protein [Ferruginibacter sp.]
GYGPTHSQTLDKFLIGIDNIKTVALNTFLNPEIIYEQIHKEEHPVIVIENKIDYGKKIFNHAEKNYKYLYSDEAYPVIKISPELSEPSLTIVSYGGMADIVNGILNDIFTETDHLPEMIIPSVISEVPVQEILASVSITGRLLVIEEGSAYAGIGAELIASIIELTDYKVKCKRISALPVPIPSVKSLENIVLPQKERIIDEIKSSNL